MKFGVENSNYRHGGYCYDGGRQEFQIAEAKALLIRIMTTRGDAAGRLPFTNEELHWSARVVRERPAWARDTLHGLGFNQDFYNRQDNDQ